MRGPGVKYLNWANGGVMVLIVRPLSSWLREGLEGEAWQWSTTGRDGDISALEVTDLDNSLQKLPLAD